MGPHNLIQTGQEICIEDEPQWENNGNVTSVCLRGKTGYSLQIMEINVI